MSWNYLWKYVPVGIVAKEKLKSSVQCTIGCEEGVAFGGTCKCLNLPANWYCRRIFYLQTKLCISPSFNPTLYMLRCCWPFIFLLRTNYWNIIIWTDSRKGAIIYTCIEKQEKLRVTHSILAPKAAASYRWLRLAGFKSWLSSCETRLTKTRYFSF